MKINPGIDHAYTLATMSNLALDYQQAGRYPEAITLFQETLELRRTKLGADHPETLASMASLGQAYRLAGRLAEAIPVLEETLKLPASEAGHRPPGHTQEHEQPRHGLRCLEAPRRCRGALE